MKLNLSPKHATSGGSLIVAMFVCTILAVSIGSYLSLTSQQYRLSMRSQEWNMSIALVEAGVEEALQHINSNSNLATCGWTYSSNVYNMTRTIGPNATYHVQINAADPMRPEITSRAVSIQQSYVQSYFPALATIGLTTPSATTPTRAVRVQTAKTALYRASVVAKRRIDLNGNYVLSDSYDSSDPNKSSNGRYDPIKYAGDFGDVACNGGIYDSVNLGNANIYGKVHTGPNTPLTIGPNGGVGTHAWQASNKGFQDGYVSKDANFTFPDTKLPSTAGLLPPQGGTAITTSFVFGTNSVTTTTYPSPVPSSGVLTNTAYKTDDVIPSPTPKWVTTNYYETMVTTLPSPTPVILFTNYFTENVTTSAYPDAGSYIGGVITNDNKNKTKITYTYNKITSVEYTIRAENYTFPTYTYTYDTQILVPVYSTNYYDAILEGGKSYVMYSMPGKTLVAGPEAKVVLPNGMGGAENIVMDHGSSITLHVGGSSVAISGNNVVNPTGFAGNFIVLCDPSVKSFTLNGNGTFTGVVVAPEADLVMNGSGNTRQDFCGALMVNNLKLNGIFNFHYDEALGKGPTNGRFLVTAWDEIK
jgi:Tfp pilus assembly protein PilX